VIGAAAPPKTSARKDGESNPPLNQETGDVIFVVDDDPDFRALLADILSDAGFRPILFNRAEGLLASLEWTIPAAIITDLVMPELSGSQLVAVLGRSERWGRIPVVVMTGNNDTSLPLRFPASSPPSEECSAIVPSGPRCCHCHAHLPSPRERPSSL
jgi:CheY-like chemotaxis protein